MSLWVAGFLIKSVPHFCPYNPVHERHLFHRSHITIPWLQSFRSAPCLKHHQRRQFKETRSRCRIERERSNRAKRSKILILYRLKSSNQVWESVPKLEIFQKL
jgi:hypothetical protein